MSTPWPDNRPFALALSHDVDRVAKQWWQFLYYITTATFFRRFSRISLHIQSLWASLRGDDPYWNFQRIMALEDELGVRSTFFFLNESGRTSLLSPKSMMLFWGRYPITAEPIQKIICTLDTGGWEVGLHGSYFSYNDEELLRREKQQLEAILSKPVVGSRQHYLNLTIPETWQIQTKIGLEYDSTLGLARQIGFRWGSYHPFYPKDPVTGTEISLLQIPLGIMDVPLMQLPDPWQAACSLIDRVEQEQGVLTLNWHQRVFNLWEYKEWQEIYVRIIRECQDRGAWIIPLKEVYTWWSNQVKPVNS